MKNILIMLVLVFSLVSCTYNTKKQLVSQDLPPELEGLVIYDIPINNGMSSIKVGFLNKEVVSTHYPTGKTQHDFILINKQTNDVIFVKEILIDNDSLIIARK